MFGKKVKQGRDSKANEILEFYERIDTDEEPFQIRRKDRQPKLLEAVINAKVLSNKTAVQQLPVTEEHAKLSSKLDQQDPKLLHTKEDLWTNQDKEQYCLEENVTSLPVTTALLKDEDGEEICQASSSVQLNQTQTQGSREAQAGINISDEQMQTETDGEPFRGAETTRSPYPDRKTLGSSMSEVRDDSDDFVYEYWQKPLTDSELESEDSDSSFNNSSAHKSGVNTDEGHSSAKKSLTCAECGKQYRYRLSFQKHVMCHSGEDFYSSE